MARPAALVTGASTGIGAVYADRFARRGHDLVIVARDARRLEDLAASLADRWKVAVETIQADLTEPADLRRVEELLRRKGTISVLVNNAGVAGEQPIWTGESEGLERMIDLNITALTRLSAAAAAAFSDRGQGTIINIGSVTALFAERLDPVYPATKAFVLAFSQALAVQLGPRGILVQVVLPGATRTEIWERSGKDLAALPAESIMEPGDLVDAAMTALDQGETVTIPSLPDFASWERLEEARIALYPVLSLSRPAARYRRAPNFEA